MNINRYHFLSFLFASYLILYRDSLLRASLSLPWGFITFLK